MTCNTGITSTALVDQRECPQAEFMSRNSAGRGPCRITQRRTEAEDRFLWDSLPPSRNRLQVAAACRSYRWASLLSVSWTTSFPDPSFRRFSAHFYQTRVVVWPIFKTAFERANHQCHNTTLYNSNLPYDEGKKNNFSHYFSKCIKLLTRWDEQCFPVARFLSECSLLHVYECLCSL